MRKVIPLITDNIYHVMARGNNHQNIFHVEADYFRLIKDLYEFNDEDTTSGVERVLLWRKPTVTGSDPVTVGKKRIKKKRKLLVEILVFCFMPNHFHLLLRQLKNGGISEYMKRVKGGYATYLNCKHGSKGSIFQSHIKAVEIKSDDQLNTVFSYIHTNPCQLVEPNWKTAGLRNEKKALEILDSYRWSSYLDYTGKKNFPSLTNRELFMELYGGAKGCANAVRGWIKHKSDSYEDFKQMILE